MKKEQEAQAAELDKQRSDEARKLYLAERERLKALKAAWRSHARVFLPLTHVPHSEKEARLNSTLTVMASVDARRKDEERIAQVCSARVAACLLPTAGAS